MGRVTAGVSPTITPADPFSRTYIIWDSPDNPTCFPTGTYHVMDGISANETNYQWSFDLHVSK